MRSVRAQILFSVEDVSGKGFGRVLFGAMAFVMHGGWLEVGGKFLC